MAVWIYTDLPMATEVEGREEDWEVRSQLDSHQF